jgi:hypothetical protein
MPSNQSIEQFLADTRLALTNAKESRIQTHVAAYGLQPDHLDAGLDLLDEAEAAYARYRTEHQENSVAVATHQEALAAFETQYVRHVKLLRVVFEEDPHAFERLGLSGTRPRTQAGLLSAGEQMYRMLQEDESLQEQAATVTVTPEAVQAALDQIAEVEALYRDRRTEKSDAEASTEARNDAIAQLRGWMFDFWRITDVALEPNPQLKEMLGRTEPSRT